MIPSDPLNSPLWPSMAATYLSDAPIVFDERVRVILPPVTEDQTQAPLAVDARGLLADGPVGDMLLIADLNPFPRTLTLTPLKAAPFLAFRMKIEQGTALRAAVRQGGVWRVGGAYLDAAGGGCSVKPATKARADLSAVGEIRARSWPADDGRTRLRLRIDHPMDNGLIAGAPVYFVETVEISAGGAPLARLTLSEAVAPDPTFTLLLDADRSAGLTIRARDNNGAVFDARLPAPEAER
ncbi:quinoprotein dehydrogenase-associated SoxYZ-like carrier [Methylopila musalis]|uniref:Quinoprotein dehydrogenase-associated SoxYZ-like carrier n=1 Tax=Methylopila musalis TaxID=1134781 RepID=A0ABW3ZAE0_9HYPH